MTGLSFLGELEWSDFSPAPPFMMAMRLRLDIFVCGRLVEDWEQAKLSMLMLDVNLDSSGSARSVHCKVDEL